MRIITITYLAIALGLLSCNSTPDDLKSEQNLLKGIAKSEQLNKPLFVHFTGFRCIGYNEFYIDLLTSKKILNKLNNEFITVELYVDDKRKIQAGDTLNIDKLVSSAEGRERIKKAKNIGHIYAAIETDWLNSNFQPLYVITDSKRNLLIEPFGYTGSDKEYFLAKLDEGLRAFNNKK